MRAAMSTTYETDMFDPLAIGNCTLNADASDERTTRKARGRTGVNAARGTSVKKVIAPRAITHTMYHRARGGRSRSKTETSIYVVGGLTRVKQVFYTNV